MKRKPQAYEITRAEFVAAYVSEHGDRFGADEAAILGADWHRLSVKHALQFSRRVPAVVMRDYQDITALWPYREGCNKNGQ